MRCFGFAARRIQFEPRVASAITWVRQCGQGQNRRASSVWISEQLAAAFAVLWPLSVIHQDLRHFRGYIEVDVQTGPSPAPGRHYEPGQGWTCVHCVQPAGGAGPT